MGDDLDAKLAALERLQEMPQEAQTARAAARRDSQEAAAPDKRRGGQHPRVGERGSSFVAGEIGRV